jgi:hypothetical protein
MTLTTCTTALSASRHPAAWLIAWLLFPLAAAIALPYRNHIKGPAKPAALTLFGILALVWCCVALFAGYVAYTLVV